MNLTFAPGTLAADTFWEILLDTDENPATGFSGRSSNHWDAGAMGAEYMVLRGANSSVATIERAVAPFGQETIPITTTGDQVGIVIPLAKLGDDDGRMTFSLSSSRQLSADRYTAILDFLPDLGQPLPRTR